MPEVSVIIPTYNCARYLGAAVDSVLAQSFSDIEVLVVDDGSKDNTPELMERYGSPVRYIRQPNGGVSVARNRGLAESQGNYVAFLDADDTWFPQKLQRQLGALTEQPACSICHTAFVIVNDDLVPMGVRHGQRAGATLDSLLRRGNVVGSICTVLAERRLFNLVGGFDSQLSQCADWDMWVRLAAHAKFLYLDVPLVTYRQHSAAMSSSIPLLERDSLRVLEKGFAMPELSPGLRARRSSAFARNYMVLAGSYFHARRYHYFIRCAFRALTLDPFQVRYLASYPARLVGRLLQKNAMARV